MTDLSRWVSVADVMQQLGCARSTAYAMLREAAGGAGHGLPRVLGGARREAGGGQVPLLPRGLRRGCGAVSHVLLAVPDGTRDVCSLTFADAGRYLAHFRLDLPTLGNCSCCRMMLDLFGDPTPSVRFIAIGEMRCLAWLSTEGAASLVRLW